MRFNSVFLAAAAVLVSTVYGSPVSVDSNSNLKVRARTSIRPSGPVAAPGPKITLEFSHKEPSSTVRTIQRAVGLWRHSRDPEERLNIHVLNGEETNPLGGTQVFFTVAGASECEPSCAGMFTAGVQRAMITSFAKGMDYSIDLRTGAITQSPVQHA
ncbi:hypothetical protein GYMLUDRAFT_91744 [Collybiopsis luxurians FD-317 M1]|nr:hypothetical protein GYMLUDRAFT_91744 [Collybiopsis luxurians FD-317 M1]